MIPRLFLSFFLILCCMPQGIAAEVLGAGTVQIVWKVSNRFRFFKDEADFKKQEQAWSEYGMHVAAKDGSVEDNDMFYYNSSVLGIEHMLNDRRIPFTKILRTKFDWRGWAAKTVDDTCYDPKSRTHAACGGVDAYINPTGHDIEISLKSLTSGPALFKQYTCHWQIGDAPVQDANCDETIRTSIPYPDGATISVNVDNERPISIDVKVKDLLVVGLGDSFASGEGNPDVPVQMDETHRVQNMYPAVASRDVTGSARWLDQACHRSLYSYQLRAALQMALENPHGAVTYLGYACSGAAIDKGIIGPQTYVEYQSDDYQSQSPQVMALAGGRGDTQMNWFLREDCREKPVQEQGLWKCPGDKFKRNVDFAFVSVGGNDIGFASLVSWATLRKGPVTRLANWFGVTTSPDEFAANMQNVLPGAYQRLARQLEKSMPLNHDGLPYDASRVVLTAYPDILADENGNTCKGVTDGSVPEDAFAANQSMDRFANWLVVRQDKMDAAHGKLESLYERMKTTADANGWTFAGRAHADAPFKGHGFCAQRQDRLDDPAEVLIMPCFGNAPRPTATCLPGILSKATGWRPYDPATRNYPYALRQRWVRTINDAYMTVNQKVIDKSGYIDEVSSARNFIETTGGMHPNAEGHASLADAMLMDLRPEIKKAFQVDQ
ncbi:SGNH/GDSL hydrolase family protein [Aestuariivirga litoralis]|uniref:SGNH/GDSL hydrolase family protein n=1 Tax=Aestuariivirga litoralis TaxID=2650924 RepID=UPI0018C79D69|nr:hypothetical protein [Aestuariivirga litoralis]MBG1232934.1 hypothetical protein [Aestuariivirga litoralis]